MARIRWMTNGAAHSPSTKSRITLTPTVLSRELLRAKVSNHSRDGVCAIGGLHSCQDTYGKSGCIVWIVRSRVIHYSQRPIGPGVGSNEVECSLVCAERH